MSTVESNMAIETELIIGDDTVHNGDGEGGDGEETSDTNEEASSSLSQVSQLIHVSIYISHFISILLLF